MLRWAVVNSRFIYFLFVSLRKICFKFSTHLCTETTKKKVGTVLKKRRLYTCIRGKAMLCTISRRPNYQWKLWFVFYRVYRKTKNVPNNMSIQRMCLLLFSIGINNVVLSLITGSIEDENGNYLKYTLTCFICLFCIYIPFYVTKYIWYCV